MRQGSRQFSRTGRRVALALAAVGVFVVVATVAPAMAGNGSERIPVGNQPFDLDPGVCAFPVHVGIVNDKEYVIHSTTLADGTVIERITGKLVESFTNSDTGKTINENVGGPGTITINPDGSVLYDTQGHSFYIFGPHGQANTGEPGLVFTEGHAVVFYNALGAGQSFSLSGTQTNGCSLLS